MCLLCGNLGDHTTHCIPPLSAHGINLYKCWPEHSCLHTLSRLPDCNSDQSIYRNQDYCIYLNRRHPRIVTTQLETLTEMPPSNISHVAIICRSAHVWEYFLMTITMVALELSMLHKSFPQLTELRGCAYYWQCLVIVTILFMYLPYPAIVDVCELSKRNKHHLWIIATHKWAVKSVWSKKYGA